VPAGGGGGAVHHRRRVERGDDGPMLRRQHPFLFSLGLSCIPSYALIFRRPVRSPLRMTPCILSSVSFSQRGVLQQQGSRRARFWWGSKGESSDDRRIDVFGLFSSRVRREWGVFWRGSNGVSMARGLPTLMQRREWVLIESSLYFSRLPCYFLLA